MSDHSKTDRRASGEAQQFEKPVHILVGLGFPRKVGNVSEAHQLLIDWPAITRNSSHGW
jgi:hypothetical protein